MADPQSPEEWLRLSASHQEAAEKLKDVKAVAAHSVGHVGFAAEAALKAYIMRQRRFNSWPSRAAEPDLYTHDLRRLQALAHIVVDPLDVTAPSWHLVLQWERNQQYDPKPMPCKVACDFYDAAFGPDGVVTWIRKTFP